MNIYRVKDLIALLNVSSQTLWRWERSGRFPKRIHLGPNAVGWPQTEIEAWLESRPRGLGNKVV